VYIIRDPELKLAQIEEVQKEVSRLLAGGNEAPAAAPAQPAEAPAETPNAEVAADVPAEEPVPEEAAPETPGEAADEEVAGDTGETVEPVGLEDEVSEPAPAGMDEVEMESFDAEEGDLLQDPETLVDEAEEAVDLDEVPEREVSGEGLTSEDREDRE
jgi:hypothetical protein